MTAILLDKQQGTTNQRVLDILFDSDDVTWKGIIFGLIKEEQMNPWDVDISIIAHKFLEMVKEFKALDFRVSGKIVLASATLLKLKSDKLMDEEIAALENLINEAEEPVELDFFDEFPMEMPEEEQTAHDKPRLVPKTPQPRKRKVSVYDLVDALEKTLEQDVQKPKRTRALYKKVEVPKGHTDISEVIKEVYGRINNHYASTQRKQLLTFDEILPSEDRQDKVMTFIPLLHLDNQRKIDVLQQEHFGTIELDLLEEDANLDELATAAEAAKN